MADTERPTAVLAGRYRLGGILGSGGMANVFDGVDERLGRPVAVKVLRPELAGDLDLRRRFEAEARAAASLTHPRVVAVYDTGEDQGNAYLVMERLPGDTLATAMGSGPVDQTWMVSMALDVLSALAAAHEVGIVHRDVKPGNILIDGAGRAKVGDFGIAKSAEQSDASLTRTGILIGTPAYMAPERIDGAAATAQSDIYGLGVVMYEALAGRKPFEGDNPLAVAYAARHVPPPPLEAIRPGLPVALAEVIERAMAVAPSARWPSADEMAGALRTAGGRAGGAPVQPAAGPVLVNAGAVTLSGGVPGAEATTVQQGRPLPTEMLGAPPLAAGTPTRRRWLAVALIAGVLALGLLIASALTGGHTASRASTTASTTVAPVTTTIDAVGAQLLRAADSLNAPDAGLMAPTVADGLRQLAADAPDSRAGPATTLLAQAGQWAQLHLLSGPAYEQVAAALVQAGATPPTTAPAPADKKKRDGGGDGGG
jgi:eukaryotic-like serine/threonine-protein kinase